MGVVKETDCIKFLKFLEKYKSHVGLADWQVFIDNTLLTTEDFAEVLPDIWEKRLKIQIGENLLYSTPSEQKNILFHELVHGRILITKLYDDQHTKLSEEHLVNDLVRGFEKIADWDKDV